jgi:hypothetical protein
MIGFVRTKYIIIFVRTKPIFYAIYESNFRTRSKTKC